MGIFHHHAIVVTSCDYDSIDRAHRQAITCRLSPSEITPKVVNGYRSFFIPPDGSKEGWDASNFGDERRSQFLAWLRAESKKPGRSFCGEWIAVNFGELGQGIDDCSVEEDMP